MYHRQFVQAITQALNNRPDHEIDQSYNQDQVATVLDAAIKVLTDSLMLDEPVNITGLGKFSVAKQQQFVFPDGDNPALPPLRHVRFRVATNLKKALNGSLIPDDRGAIDLERPVDSPQKSTLVNPPRIERPIPPRILQNMRQRAQQRTQSRDRNG